ncbi:MAG: ribokinase [Hyphomonadaceae bacterium]|nr:MAG: ribokinase [Caulobacteraceae bacterium]MBT9445551.1 ribokinase [Hyphomonadaceae bacterium]TPW04815.1 MAG: ribokinase [Alphaproteobacteria bacterium]
MSTPRILVVGSVNLDFVATAAKLPAPGETVTGATLARHPGGKGANQALAARRLGAEVALAARVGRDAMADEALALLRAGGVDLSACAVDDAAATGVALIAVAADGENQIVVAPGANAAFSRAHLAVSANDAVICQLEIPMDTVLAVAERAAGLFCINLAPSASTPDAIFARADLVVVNEGEAMFQGAALNRTPGLVAVTEGARGAALYRGGVEIARASPPSVKVVDTTGAGDAFVGALVMALLEKQPPEQALRFACAAGALAATKPGAQPSLPLRDAVDRLLAGAA